MNLVHRSIGFSAIDRYGSTLFQVVSLAVLARLLTPEEFGVYTAIAAFTALANVSSREFGGPNYLIQKPCLTDDDIKTAFTISLLMAIAFAAILFGVRDMAARFYAQPGLKIGIAVAAWSFLLSPFSGTISALLRRELKFDTIAACSLTANFVTAVTSIALAVFGFSFMSPILGSVLGQAVLVGLLMKVGGGLRIFAPSLKGWRDVIGFGAYSSAAAIVNMLYQTSPPLILGRVLSFADVGLYGRALNITQIFDKLVLDVVNPVVMPAIAGQARAGADLKSVYLSAVELLTAVQWPCLLFTAIAADPIVVLLLGPSWIETIPLVRILCFASLALFAACLTYPTLVTLGRVRDTFTATLISVPASLGIFFVASFHGLEAVAVSALIALPLQALVALSFISRRLGIGAGDWFSAISKSIVVALLSAGVGVVAIAFDGIGFSNPVIKLGEAAVGTFAGWYIGLVLTHHPLLPHIREMVSGMLSPIWRPQCRREARMKDWKRGVAHLNE